MPRKKDTEPKDEALEPEDDDTEDTSSDDDLLPKAGPAPARGGSGAVWAVVLVIVVLALVVTAVLYLRDRQDKAAAARKLEKEQVMGQLDPAKNNIARAAEEIEGDLPDVASAIQALNRAAEQVGELALTPRATKAGVSPQLVDLQGELRDASANLKNRNDQYLEAVAAAQKDLRTAALAEVKPLADRIEILKRGAQGDVDTPLVVPGVSSLPSGGEQPETAPEAAPEAEAGKSNP